MSRISRDDLKSIVKECLVEILSEGLVSSATKVNEVKATKVATQPRMGVQGRLPEQGEFRRKLAENVRVGPPQQNNHAENIAKVTSDPILAEILADTANTTLVKMIQAEGRPMASGPVDSASMQAMNSDPMDLFEGADKWSDLAFAPKRNGPL